MEVNKLQQTKITELANVPNVNSLEYGRQLLLDKTHLALHPMTKGSRMDADGPVTGLHDVERISELATDIRLGLLHHGANKANSLVSMPASLDDICPDTDRPIRDTMTAYLSLFNLKTQFSIPDLARYWYWIIERYRIHKIRQSGALKPWTNDPIMRQWFFTNPYREDDRTTVWFREYIRDPLRDTASVFMATVIFRWFNYIPTGQVMITGKVQGMNDPLSLINAHDCLNRSILVEWNYDKAVKLLHDQRDKHGKVFTGAFMIKPYQTMDKIEGICKCIDKVWRDRDRLLNQIIQLQKSEALSMEWLCGSLCKFPGLGGFMSYEIVSDLRYTWILKNAHDILTWANLGPGGIRGVNRILGIPADSSSPKNWREVMKDLLLVTVPVLITMPGIEMREIEHSLCEFDKYSRAWFGEGKMKRTYPGRS